MATKESSSASTRSIVRSLSDSEVQSECNRSTGSGRLPFIQDQTSLQGHSGTRIWLLLSQTASPETTATFTFNNEVFPAEEVIIREKIIMLTIPKMTKEAEEKEVSLSLSIPSQPNFVSLPFNYIKQFEAPKHGNVLEEFAVSGDSLSLLLPLTHQIHDKDEDGNTVLHLAARNGQNYALKLILSALQKEPECRRRVTVNHRNNRGQTALHCAVRAEDADAVHYLLSAGAQLSLADNHSDSVLHYLADSHNEAIYKEVLERTLSKEHLDAVNEDGFTPLHLAVRRLKLSLLETLIDVGANVNSLDRRGRTSIIHAVEMNDVDIVVYLLSKGADPNIEDCDGETSLLLSNKVANMVMMGHLLDAGADPRKETKNGAALVQCEDEQVQRIIAGERVKHVFKEDGLVKNRPALFGISSLSGGERVRAETEEADDEEELVNEETRQRIDLDQIEEDLNADEPSTSSSRPRPRRQKHDAYGKDDISCLDYLTRLRLSKILDETSKWEALAKELECEHMVELISICSFDSSPTMILLDQFEQLPDAKISRVREALQRLNEEQAVELIEQRFVY